MKIAAELISVQRAEKLAQKAFPTYAHEIIRNYELLLQIFTELRTCDMNSERRDLKSKIKYRLDTRLTRHAFDRLTDVYYQYNLHAHSPMIV